MGHYGADTQAHQFWQMQYGASKINHRTALYIYWIWGWGTLGQTHKHTSFGRWNMRLPRATTGPQFKSTGFEDWALWGRHKSTPDLTDELWGFQQQPQDYNLDVLDLVMGHFWAETQAQQFWQMNNLASKSDNRTTIYIYWVSEDEQKPKQGFWAGHKRQTHKAQTFGRWTIGLPE